MLSYLREPRNLSDPNIWARYEAAQNRRLEGSITSYLYSDSGTLKIKAGKIGINDGVTRGVITIDTDTTIDISGNTTENWIKIEIAVSDLSGAITATDVSGETDKETLPSEFTSAYDEIKNGYYVASTKRCIGLVYIDEDSELYIVNVLSLQNGYYSDKNYAEDNEIFNVLIPEHSEIKTKSLININMQNYLKPYFYSTWNTQASATDSEWRGITYSEDLELFCAVNTTGTAASAVMTSPDGITWTSRTAPNSNEWHGVAWSPSLTLFAAVSITGSGNRVMTSPDGITWTIRTSVADLNWRRVIWIEDLSLFVAVANTGGGNQVMTSPDGTTWTRRTTPSSSWWAITWSSELTLIVVTSVSGAVMTSPDGITWTSRTAASSRDWFGVAWSPKLSLFCAVASSGSGDRVMTSPDGTTWTNRVNPEDNDWKDVVWAEDIDAFIAVADSGIGDRIMTSRDGYNWKMQDSPANNDWYSMAYAHDKGLIVSVSRTGTGDRAMTSLIIQ